MKEIVGNRGIFLKKISNDQAKDTGMAMCLIALILGHIVEKHIFFVLAVVLLVLNMTIPALYKPIAKGWFGVSEFVGTMVSRLLLTLVFFMLVTPMGTIRALLGKDSLKLKKWKKDSSSVFDERFYSYSKSDLEKPY